MQAYVKPTLEVVGSLHALTLDITIPYPDKIVGGNLDGVKLNLGHGVKVPLGYS